MVESVENDLPGGGAADQAPHYDDLPLAPGIDGVGRNCDGCLWFFMTLGGGQGSMAQRAVINTRNSVLLPEGIDPVAMAGTLNGAIAPWLVFSQRILFQKGQSELVFGATGGTGRLSAASDHR